MNRLEQVEFVRGLKGAPASIVLALVLFGGSLLKSDLEQMTGYSDKPIAKGLALLELKGLVQYNGYQYGWSLTAGVRQLPLFPESLLDAGDGDQSRKFSDFIVQKDHESRRISDSYTTTTTTTTKDSDLQEEVVVVSNGESRRISDSGVEEWLIRGGIGRNSPKMRQLLKHDLGIDYVKSHVLERLATIARPDGGWFHTGLLIRKLLDGDAAPAMRCEECLAVVTTNGCQCGRRCKTCGETMNSYDQLYHGECLFCAGIIER